MMKLTSFIATIVVFLSFFTNSATAQLFDESTIVKHDTNYIKIYKDELTTRMFLSRKQNGYTLSDRLLNPWIRYKTNDNLLLGIGYTYSFLTLNLAVKMPFINRDDDIYGKSKYVDLQSHTIFRSYILDLYIQWNKGYYISNPDEVFETRSSSTVYPYRGDLRTNILGLNIQYLFNSSRYSYKASFLQNEFQRKSAGSPILGIEGYWMLGMGDSLIVPGSIPPRDFVDNVPFNQADLFNVGLNGGYAYTFVWKESIYLSLSSVIGLACAQSVMHNTETSGSYRSGISLGINNVTRASLGFNKNDFFIGVSYIGFTMTNLAGGDNDWISYSTGNIRFNVVKRFKLKRSIKILRPDLWIF
ncbi:MAG: DUF4421 family protein [Bacteroidales bacterium]|nr:DUF4421 family protein [Bacteroidales bacterium]